MDLLESPDFSDICDDDNNSSDYNSDSREIEEEEKDRLREMSSIHFKQNYCNSHLCYIYIYID